MAMLPKQTISSRMAWHSTEFTSCFSYLFIWLLISCLLCSFPDCLEDFTAGMDANGAHKGGYKMHTGHCKLSNTDPWHPFVIHFTPTRQKFQILRKRKENWKKRCFAK